MMISRASTGSVPLTPDPYREAAAVADYESGTLESIGANIAQGYTEMGASQIFRGIRVGYEETHGNPIDEQTYKNSPSYRPGLSYYQGMTEESARELSNYEDIKQQRQFIIDKADTFAVGTIGYIAGTVAEPINALAGIATMGIGTTLMTTKMAAHIASKSRIGARLGAYGTEGLVAAAATEPFNRFGAGMLHDDYSMADSALNIVSSTILSAGLGSAGHFLEQRAKIKGAARAYEEAREELDVATKQMVAGQEIDVRGVQKPISKMPVAEKAAMVESFVKYTETPEFAARFAGSKVVDESGAPLRVYHGTEADFAKFDISKVGKVDEGFAGEGFYFTKDPQVASEYAAASGSDGGNIRPSYLSLKNPFELDVGKRASDMTEGEMSLRALLGRSPKEFSDKLKAQGFDGAIMTNNGEIKEYVAFNPDQVISAFGADDLDSIAARIDTDNAAITQQAILKANDPTNSTAIDTQAVDEVNAYAERYPDEGYQEELIQYEQEISAMNEQGLLSEEDIAMLEYVNTLNEEDVLRGYEAAFLCLTRG